MEYLLAFCGRYCSTKWLLKQKKGLNDGGWEKMGRELSGFAGLCAGKIALTFQKYTGIIGNNM